jgi:D-serine deaminase-like pyridoxal phosphate-dependent protein
VEYSSIGSKEKPDEFTSFKPALSLLTSVVSANHRDFVTIDAGLKTLYRDGGIPRVITLGFSHLKFDWSGDEYGELRRSEGEKLPQLGDVLEMTVAHCDPTVNQFDYFYVTKEDCVIDKWPIDLRGKSQ